jgi:hypothetical protein
MSTPNPLLVAAAPSLIASLEALQTFVANLGTDPAQVAIKFPGAAAVLLGQLELQAPALLAGEFGAAQTAVNGQINNLIAKLKAATTTPAA